MKIYQQWLETCRQADIPAITLDTAARILAIVYLCSNNENFTYNAKLKADVDYICKRWHIEGGESVSDEIHPLICQYSEEIETFMENNPRNFDKPREVIYPQWCEDLIFARYKFHIFQ